MRPVFGINVTLFVEIHNFAGDLRGVCGRVEARDPPNAADPVASGFPVGLAADSVGADCSNARDYDATFHKKGRAESHKRGWVERRRFLLFAFSTV
jgi:hypothetical protein